MLSVKWGTRYPASYVNKLYAGIKRYTSWTVDFYCFTEDPSDLHADIKPMPLEEGWKKWWGKVTLFKDHGIKGRKFYIDLDMVITGNLDEMFEYGGEFSILRTGDLACEKNHKDGYNSSVMIWNDDILVPVYEALKENFEFINKFIVRFDFWLEMTIRNADYVQVLYPKQVVDYLADAQKGVPENSRVVCFARKPKPDDYPAEWIR